MSIALPRELFRVAAGYAMGVVLVDLNDESRSEFCNWWNWRPTIELLRRSQLLPPEHLELMGYNGTGIAIEEADARKIHAFIATTVLPELERQDQLSLDGTKTSVLNGVSLHTDVQSNYGATRPWLERFAEFCRTCGGFEVS